MNFNSQPESNNAERIEQLIAEAPKEEQEAIHKVMESRKGKIAKSGIFAAAFFGLMTTLGCAQNGERFDIRKSFEGTANNVLHGMHDLSVAYRNEHQNVITEEYHHTDNIGITANPGHNPIVQGHEDSSTYDSYKVDQPHKHK